MKEHRAVVRIRVHATTMDEAAYLIVPVRLLVPCEHDLPVHVLDEGSPPHF